MVSSGLAKGLRCVHSDDGFLDRRLVFEHGAFGAPCVVFRSTVFSGREDRDGLALGE